MAIVSIPSVVRPEGILLNYNDVRVIEVALLFLMDESNHGSSCLYGYQNIRFDAHRLSTWINQSHLKRYVSLGYELVWPMVSKKDLLFLMLAIEHGVTLNFLEWHIHEEANREKEMSDDYRTIYPEEDFPVFDVQEKIHTLQERYLPVLQFKVAALAKLRKFIS